MRIFVNRASIWTPRHVSDRQARAIIELLDAQSGPNE
jgi:hypothetical protein